MQPRTAFVFLCFVIAGCSQQPATVTGSFSLNGKPFPLPPNAGEVFVSFHGLGEDGKIDVFKKYTGLVKPDGSFEIVSSAGQLPLGTYQWSIDSAPGRVKEFEPFSLDKSKARIELKPGPNNVLLDLGTKN